ncbi:hypothetical protein F2P81_010644 [Scophthalmus maximus]|uniref:FHA domain-containing protein n=1 Tax=Scophthalmus maximus TaxID=52904 RepID=A0A6A4T168_SCOMX|nr:hypothetical protein F2P81_010644 [Scophthalmus maximus]
MIFVGRDDCELMLQSRSVDKQHAVINYEPNTDEHKVKDLGSLNGTFVNDVRILEQIYVTLKLDDKLRFGYDILSICSCAVRQHPHEKYSSQLQLNKMKPPGGETSKSEVKPSEAAAAVCEATTAKPTEASKAEDKTAGKLSDEAPSREQDAGSSAAAEPVHGHASFTIEFDPGASGKVTVKDRGAKVGPETRPRPKRPVGEELSPLQTAMVAAEVKVADWLAQNELPLALKEAVAEEDGESVKSDVPVHLRSLKGSKHEDGTQSDSENALGEQRRAAALDERSWVLWGGAGMKIREGRANVPEGLFAEEDSPARRRKSSTSKVTGGFVERRRGSAPQEQSGRNECQHHGDDYSDRGTYTIELENGDHEEEEARKMIDKALSEELVVGGPRWVSQWATLAASHIRTDPEGSGGESHIMVTEDRAEISESSHSASFASSGYTERKRRTLPQLPGEELALGRRTPGSGLRTEMGEKQDTELQEKENQQEKMARGKHRPGHGTGGVGSRGGSPGRSSPAKSQDSGGGRSAQSGVLAKLPPRPLTSGEKRMEEARRRKKEEERARESGGKPLLRQESFTVEKPSSNVPIELRPRIDALTGSRPQSRETGVDSVALQKDSEAVAAFLETTVSDQGDPPSQSIEGSMSPESDVDTTSTVSQAEGARKVVQRRRTLAGQQKEKTVVCSSTGTRWRRVPVEYASTSEDEYGSNRHMSKQGQTKPFPSTRVAQLGGSAPATPNPTGLTALKQHSREQDEYMRDWTAHSEEIARISQDLAKDLAMLAREIHDVAGEIDSVSPAATDPGALLEESVFVDNVDVGGAATEQSGILATNGRSVELRSRSSRGQGSRSIRRQTWNRDDAVLDSLLIASVTQLSARIRQSVDKTSCKIRILFKDRERKWEEIENKLQAEHDSLVLKSSNKEISTIIQDLKRVERQLLVIDMMVDPDGILDALPNLGLTSPLADQRTGPGTQQQALVLHPGAEASSCTLSAPRPEGLTSEPRSSTEL